MQTDDRLEFKKRIKNDHIHIPSDTLNWDIVCALLDAVFQMNARAILQEMFFIRCCSKLINVYRGSYSIIFKLN